MTEIETIKRAKMYIDKMASGINPLDDSVIPDGDVLNNVKISRCLFFTSDILRQIIENNGIKPAKKIAKVPFNITYEQLQKFKYSETPVAISRIADELNSLVDNEEMKKISYKPFNDWLIDIEMLCVETKADGKTTKAPTEQGRNIGISIEQRVGNRGEYTVVLYNRKAQEFLIDNIEAVISRMNNSEK